MAEKKLLSRRSLLKGAAASMVLLAAACQPQVVEVEKIVTQVVKETVEVEKVVEKEVEVEKVVTQVVEVEKIVEVERAAEVTGTFWVLQKKDFFPAMNEWFRAQMVSFCKEKGWPLDISYMSGYTGGTPEIEKLIASVAAGTPADLIMHDLGIVQLRQAYALDSVSDVVEDIEAAFGPASARQKNDLYTDDQWWAVPYFTRSDGGWFQRSVIEGASVDIHGIRQFVDLWETLLEVTQPDKELYGWGVTINASNDGNWFRRRMFHGYGAYRQDETGQYCTFDSPEAVEAMTVMTDLYMNEKWESLLPPGVLAWTDMNNNEAYLAGKLIYTFNGGTVLGKAILDGNPIKDDTGFHAPPGGPVNEEFNSLSANNWMILRGARNPDAAKETIRHFMLSLENQDAIFENAPAFALPAYADVWAQSKYIQTNKTAAELEKVARDEFGRIPGQYPGPAQNPALASADAALIENDMVASILNGTPVAEAVKTCHERYVAIFKEFGLPGEKE
ncbi:MAG: extracellular solute-binding protein [Chloroflexi bacterium]|nr:extracellular solute-binding protein [Chloroflexota bacterium]